MTAEPKFRRRKADRPTEIVQAAMAVFAEKGFAAAKLDEIAARAGVSKGALYLYFETKDDLFRAVVRDAISPNLVVVKGLIAAHPGPFESLVRAVADRVATLIDTTPLGGVAKMVIGEARNFPELARLWYDELVSQLIFAVAAAIEAAQARGEVRPGNPQIYALQLAAPLLMTTLWRETFTPVGAPPFDTREVLAQHADTFLRGLRPDEARS